MIIITISLFYSLLLLFLAGLLTSKILQKVTRSLFSFTILGVVNILLLGIVFLTTFTSLVSLISPVNGFVHLLFLIGVISYAAIDRFYVSESVKIVWKQATENKVLMLIGVILISAGVLFASNVLKWYDTGLYHMQAVQWLNDYKAVPGLGNLHFRLAFNSAWLVFASFFDVLILDGRSAHLVNLIVFVIAVIICLDGFYKVITKNVSVSAILRCLLIFFFFALNKEVNSLSTDFPASLLLLYILILVVEFVERKSIIDLNSQEYAVLKTYFWLIVTFSAFALTVKLNGVPILLFSLYLFLSLKNKNKYVFVVSLLIGLVIVAPFLIRNVILSGYLIFPFPQLDIFGFDWKVPYEDTLFINLQTKYWAIRPGEWYMDIPETPFQELFSVWVSKRFLPNIKISIFLIVAPVLLLVLTALCLLKEKFKNCIDFAIIQIILTFGVLFWLYTAPSPRLGAGWILGFGLFPLAVLLHYLFLTVKPLNTRFYVTRFAAYAAITLFSLWFIKVAAVNFYSSDQFPETILLVAKSSNYRNRDVGNR